MAKDRRKHQKNVERRKAKSKARNKLIAAKDRGVAGRIERSVVAPILHCCTTSSLSTQGLSQVLISRQLSSGNVAYVMFLLDVYCLGVKDVLFDVTSRVRYDANIHNDLAKKYDLVPLTPEAARKLIEGAVEYAKELGLPPHKDYSKAQRIFGDTDAEACAEEFEYGKDGKPFFIAGPHDTPARCDRIMRILQSRRGSDGYHYLLPFNKPGFAELVGEEDQIVGEPGF